MAALLIVEDDRKTNEAICEYLILQAFSFNFPERASLFSHKAPLAQHIGFEFFRILLDGMK